MLEGGNQKMWKQSAAILLFSVLLLVGCNNDKAIEDTRNETPMEDVNRGINEGVTDDGITDDGVNNGVNNGTTDVERGINEGINNVQEGAKDVKEDVKQGIEDITPGDQTPDDRTIVDDDAANGNINHYDKDNNK